LVVLLPIMLGVVWTLLHNEAMTVRLLPMLPPSTVKVMGGRGALLGDFSADRIEIALPRGGYVRVQDVAWKGLDLWPDLGVRWHFALRAKALSARRAEFMWVAGPPSTKDEPLSDLDLPLSVKVGRVQVGEAYSSYWGTAPLRQVDGALGLQVPVGMAGAVGLGQRQHTVKLAGVAWQAWTLSGEASAVTDGKMPIDAGLLLQGRPDPEAAKAVQADLRVQGPLAHMQVKGRLSLAEIPQQEPLQGQKNGADTGGAALPGPPQELGRAEVDAEVAPLAPWPLSRLRALFDDLDIAAVQPGLPATSLSGEVVAEPVARQDLQARLNLRNARAGPWDEALLPLRSVQGQISLLGARSAKDVAQTLRDGVVDLALQLPSLGQAEPAALSLQGGWGGTR